MGAACASGGMAQTGDREAAAAQPTGDFVYVAVQGDAQVAVIGPSGRFGVLDILSGRPRLGDATAVADCRLLVIEAEDFFDLLSNNIEIVRALFRTVVALSDHADERLL